jgi:hypothetical protein
MHTLRQVRFGQDDAPLHAPLLIDVEPLNNHHTVVYREKTASTCQL